MVNIIMVMVMMIIVVIMTGSFDGSDSEDTGV